MIYLVIKIDDNLSAYTTPSEEPPCLIDLSQGQVGFISSLKEKFGVYFTDQVMDQTIANRWAMIPSICSYQYRFEYDISNIEIDEIDPLYCNLSIDVTVKDNNNNCNTVNISGTFKLILFPI